jgi:hypothetical protein
MKIIATILAMVMSSSAFAMDVSNVSGKVDMSAVYAQHKVWTDYGGSISEYIKKYEDIADKKAKVEIRGTCISACTLVLGTVPREDICVGPNARWAFHSAHFGMGQFASEGTRLIWEIYPEDVQEALKARGWDGSVPEEHPDLIYFKGTDFAKPCDSPNAEFDRALKAVEEVFTNGR